MHPFIFDNSLEVCCGRIVLKMNFDDGFQNFHSARVPKPDSDNNVRPCVYEFDVNTFETILSLPCNAAVDVLCSAVN